MPLQRDSDHHLVLGLQAGSVASFERLYELHHAAVYNLCARVLCDREEAQDVTQDVFLKAFASPPVADERLNLRGWLYRVATNACFNVLRNRKRGGDGDAIEAVAAPVDEFERAHTAALVEQSLGQLNDRYRTALVLKDLHGMRPAEIAGVLQISRPAADVLVHRARTAFRGAFARLAGEGPAAPASLGTVLVPLAVPAALHVAPPLPALPTAPHAPAPHAAHPTPHPTPPGGAHLPALPDPSTLAGPGAAGLLSHLGESLAAKVAVTAAAAGLLVGGGVAVDRSARHGAEKGAAQAAVRIAATPSAAHWAAASDGHHSEWGLPLVEHGVAHDTSHHAADHSGTHDAAHSGDHSGSEAAHAGEAAHDAGSTTATHSSGSAAADHSSGSATTSGDASGGAGHDSGSDGGSAQDGGDR